MIDEGDNLSIQFSRSENLIPGMVLWKQYLLICVPAAAVAFEVFSLRSYALRETTVSLPETVLKIVFQNTSQQRCHIALDVRNVSKFLSFQGIF
jgi:hypothetical protein